MLKSLKEYLGISTIRVGGLDSIQPMASLSRKGTDIAPKDKGGRDSRAVGLVAGESITPFKKKILQKLSKPIKDYNKKKEKKEDGMTGPGMGTMNAMPSIVTRKIKESALYKHMQKKGIIR
jgi:hypothetical protein